MKKNMKKFIMNPWTVSIGSGLLVLLVTIVVDIANAETVFSTIKKVICVIWNAFVRFLNFNVKVWWILIFLAVAVAGLYVWSKILESIEKSSAPPEFTKYTVDTILGYKWKWIWEKDYQGKYRIEELHTICSFCDTPLSYDWGEYKCLRCNRNYNNRMPNENNVKMLISDNVRRKYFPND